MFMDDSILECSQMVNFNWPGALGLFNSFEPDGGDGKDWINESACMRVLRVLINPCPGGVSSMFR